MGTSSFFDLLVKASQTLPSADAQMILIRYLLTTMRVSNKHFSQAASVANARQWRAFYARRGLKASSKKWLCRFFEITSSRLQAAP